MAPLLRLATVVVVAASCAACLPPGKIYATTPSLDTRPLGHFGYGLVLADVNLDGHKDIVVASGNDWSPQPVTVYLYDPQGNSFGSYPSWYSEGFEHYLGLAAGDIDLDGRLDAAAAVIFGQLREPALGGIDVFTSVAPPDPPGLAAAPDAARRGYQAIGVALGDVDADGDLDVIVAAQKEADGTPGAARIYLNKGGVVDTKPWTSSPLGASAVVATDFDDDGWVDLAFRAPKLHVFYGAKTSPDTVPFQQTPDWSSETDELNSHSLDVARVGTDPRMAIVTPSSSGVDVYRPSRSGSAAPTWTNKDLNLVFDVYPAEVTGDGIMDLVTGGYASKNPLHQKCGLDPAGARTPICIGGWLEIYTGTQDGFATRRGYRADQRSVFQRIAGADTFKSCVVTRKQEFEVDAERSVFTLDDRRIEDIEKVTVGGVEIHPPPAPPGTSVYTHAIAENWIAVSPPVQPKTKVEVEYATSNKLDLIASTGVPAQGTWIFEAAPVVCEQ